MIGPRAGTRVWLAAGVTDMRCGMDTLAAKVQTALTEDPYSGHVFVFRGRRGDLVKLPAEGTTKVHVRFKGGRTETVTTLNPNSSVQRVRTPPKTVELVDKLLDEHTCSEIADLLKEQGLRPGGAVRPGCAEAQFTALRVAYLAHSYGLRSRYDRLRDRGMLTKAEAATRLNIHECTLVRWATNGLIARHAYNAHAYLYEDPGATPPSKHCSRWDRLVDRTAANKKTGASMPSPSSGRGAV